jgi:hypothetical protein
MNVYTRGFFVRWKEEAVSSSTYRKGAIGTRRIPPLFSFLFWSPSLCVEAAFYVYLSRVWVVVGVIEEGVTKAGRWFFPSLNEKNRTARNLCTFSLPPHLAVYLDFVYALFGNWETRGKLRASLLSPILCVLPILARHKAKVFPPTFNLVAYIWRTVSEGGSACPQKLWGWHNRWNVNTQRALSPNSCQQYNIIWTICVRIPLTIAGWIYFSPLRLCGGGGLVRIRRHPGHMLPSQPSPHTLISPMRVQPFTFSIPTNIGPTVELWIY